MGKKAALLAIEKLNNGEIDVPFEVSGRDRLCVEAERLRQKLLAQKIELADRDNEINERIAEVAHDLKTPIATISGYAECIQDGVHDRDYPSLIIEKANEMNEQVLSIVESARAGKTEGRKICVETDAFFTRAIKEAVGESREKKVTVAFRRLRKVHVYIDAQKIYRVIQNIINNAVKYGREEVTVRVKGSVRGDKYVLSIKDDGTGINKSDVKYVFNKFYRGDKSRGGKGNGLGLFICKEFIEEHGGEIKVKSNGKKGTEILFSLPIISLKKIPSIEKFESKSKGRKMLTFLFFGWIYSGIFRFMRYSEKKCVATLVAGIFALLPFSPMWLIDLVSEAVYSKTVFLAD